MCNINRRRQFDTVAELRTLLENLPGGMNVTICGQRGGFCHETEDRTGICLDYSEPEECYGEESEIPEESTWRKQLLDRQNNMMRLLQEYTGETEEKA